MAKTVLLARPHPFIVSEMKPFLEQNGYSPKQLDSLVGMASSVVGASGAIISLAVVSSIGESAETVFTELRKSAPRLPVLFASIIDFAAAKSTMERLAKNAGFAGTILGIDQASDSSSALGKPDTFLFLNKDDLVSPEKRALATRIIKRHFQ
jgi:hypothetical protein